VVATSCPPWFIHASPDLSTSPRPSSNKPDFENGVITIDHRENTSSSYDCSNSHNVCHHSSGFQEAINLQTKVTQSPLMAASGINHGLHGGLEPSYKQRSGTCRSFHIRKFAHQHLGNKGSDKIEPLSTSYSSVPV